MVKARPQRSEGRPGELGRRVRAQQQADDSRRRRSGRIRLKPSASMKPRVRARFLRIVNAARGCAGGL